MHYTLFLRLFIFVFITNAPAVVNAKQIYPLHSIQQKLAKLEDAAGGRLGLSVINTANNARIQYRGDERFPFCSTGKTIVVAAILKESEKHPTLLKRIITYNRKDLANSGYAPIAQQHLVNGMNVNDLCQAAIEYSDNTAMNLLIKALGGIKNVNSYARSIHDHVFRLDRFEPELNTAIPGDLRDTTTPNAMVNSLKQLTLGNALAIPQREQLQTWLKNNTTGNTKIRAGVPPAWIVGDKTGSGSYGTTNDIAVIWPPRCSPIVITVYLTQREKDAIKYDAVIAAATRLVLKELAQNDQCIKIQSKLAKDLVENRKISIRQACRVVNIDRKTHLQHLLQILA